MATSGGKGKVRRYFWVGLEECAGPAGDYRGLKNLMNWKEFGMRLGLKFVVEHAVLPHEGVGGLNRSVPPPQKNKMN